MRKGSTVLGLICLVVLLVAASTATAEETGLWLRYPAISPDGEMIAFSYHGDL
ncbi:MAG: hypothetical protein ACC742_01665 [Thermoanaerobaculales bacterium]